MIKSASNEGKNFFSEKWSYSDIETNQRAENAS